MNMRKFVLSLIIIFVLLFSCTPAGSVQFPFRPRRRLTQREICPHDNNADPSCHGGGGGK
ncbi:unnamed protein product [Rhodiola kirilowii]